MSKSLYADRETVGTIALNASKKNDRVVAGDLGHELMPQLVDDLNEAISSNPFDSKPFYITIHEKKDLLLTNVMLRRVIKQEKRPYPEPSTMVFWTDPKSQEVLFCWSLPARADFQQYLNNASKYSKDQIKDIYAYSVERLDHFGFQKIASTDDNIPVYQTIKNFKDRKIGNNNLIFTMK